jgi:hypothetical protein
MSNSHAVGWASDAPTPAQLKEFFAQIGAGRITKGKLQSWLLDDTDIKSIKSWVGFYNKFFNTALDLSDVKVPEHLPEFGRHVVVLRALHQLKVFELMGKYFPCRTDDMDKVAIRSDRDPVSGTYIICIRDKVEADQEMKNLSAKHLQKKAVNGITLLERMLYELKYWDETGKHLDEQGTTLCLGSINSDGTFPGVYWDDNCFVIRRISPDTKSLSIAARVAVDVKG